MLAFFLRHGVHLSGIQALNEIHYNTESMENCICVGRGTTHLEILFTRVAGGDEDDPSSSMIHQDDTG